MAGRKPLGPALVNHLDGSASAKERLELILQTLAGQVTVVAACGILGISEAMFYKLRNRVLQVCLEDLEPKTPGRPTQIPTTEKTRYIELATELATLQRELAVQAVRLEIAQTLPTLAKPVTPGPVKKTNRQPNRRQKRRQQGRK